MSKTLADMTPEEARRLIKADSGSTHGPWTDCHNCKAVRQNAWKMIHQIAGMKWEYRAESPKGAEFASSPWTDEKEARDIFQKSKNGLATLGINPTGHVRLVRRLVSQPEEAKAMSKWRVRIEGAGGWAVFNPHRGSKRWFPTHAEALAYADRKARTREEADA